MNMRGSSSNRSSSRLLEPGVRVVLQLRALASLQLRYFCYLPGRNGAGADSFVARAYGERIPDGGGAHEFLTYLVDTDGAAALIVRDRSLSHNLVVKRSRSSAHESGDVVYFGVGGQDMRPRYDSRDGVRLLSAPSLGAVRDGVWLNPSHEGNLLFEGSHAGCVTARNEDQVCEFDGKMGAAFVPSTGAWHVFVRQNYRQSGGRYVAVLTSTSGISGPYGSMRALQIVGHVPGEVCVTRAHKAQLERHGTNHAAVHMLPHAHTTLRSPGPHPRAYDHLSPAQPLPTSILILLHSPGWPTDCAQGNLYFAAVDTNPVDETGESLLGLFPVNEGQPGCGNW